MSCSILRFFFCNMSILYIYIYIHIYIYFHLFPLCKYCSQAASFQEIAENKSRTNQADVILYNQGTKWRRTTILDWHVKKKEWETILCPCTPQRSFNIIYTILWSWGCTGMPLKTSTIIGVYDLNGKGSNWLWSAWGQSCFLLHFFFTILKYFCSC